MSVRTSDEAALRQFADLRRALGPRVDAYDATARGFGASSIKKHGRIVAMLVDGRLVVKLPADRVAALVESGHGTRFDPGHGRLMKEWAVLVSRSPHDWTDSAKEALAFATRPVKKRS